MKRKPDITRDDELGSLIGQLVSRYKPRTILEIGSSDGMGSTQVFLRRKDIDCKLFCIELLEDRFNDLVVNVRDYSNVYCYRLPSVSKMMSRKHYKQFRKDHPDYTGFRVLPESEWDKWYDNTKAEIELSEIKDGIEHIKSVHRLSVFDMVLIDGGAFTGLAELEAVYGSKIIILDDTVDIKCFDAKKKLIRDDKYALVHNSDTYRNGYSVFKLKQA